MKCALLLASLGCVASSAPAVAQGCLTDADVDRAVGEQVRSGAPLIDTRALAGRPLCSGLTITQAIQRLREQAFPQDAAEEDAMHRAMVAQETAPRRTVRRPARRTTPVHATQPHAPAQPVAPSRKVSSKTGTSTAP